VLQVSLDCPFLIAPSVFPNIYFIYFLSDPPYKPIDDFSADDLTKLFDLNVVGYFMVSKVSFCQF
jgi:hypothetical protein